MKRLQLIGVALAFVAGVVGAQDRPLTSRQLNGMTEQMEELADSMEREDEPLSILRGTIQGGWVDRVDACLAAALRVKDVDRQELDRYVASVVMDTKLLDDEEARWRIRRSALRFAVDAGLPVACDTARKIIRGDYATMRGADGVDARVRFLREYARAAKGDDVQFVRDIASGRVETDGQIAAVAKRMVDWDKSSQDYSASSPRGVIELLAEKIAAGRSEAVIRMHMGSAGASMTEAQVQRALADESLKDMVSLYAVPGQMDRALKEVAAIRSERKSELRFVTFGPNAAYSDRLSLEIGMNRFLGRWYLTYLRTPLSLVRHGDFIPTAFENVHRYATLVPLRERAARIRKEWSLEKRLEFIAETAIRHRSPQTLRAFLLSFEAGDELKALDVRLAELVRTTELDWTHRESISRFALERSLGRTRDAVRGQLESTDSDYARRRLLECLWMSPAEEDVQYVRALATKANGTVELQTVAKGLVDSVAATEGLSGRTPQEMVARLGNLLAAGNVKDLYACYLAPETRSYQEEVEAYVTEGMYDEVRFAMLLKYVELLHASNATELKALGQPGGLDTADGVRWGPFWAYRGRGFEFGLRRLGGRWYMNYIYWPFTISGPHDIGAFD